MTDGPKNGETFDQDKKFKCYVPLDIQSYILKFNPDLQNQSEEDIKQELAAKFAVIGINEQMHKSICLIATKYTGKLPDACDCSGETRRRKLLTFSHNVTHHANTFNRTKEEDEMIDILTKKDQLLYRYALEIFDQQVKEVEDKLGITMCDTFETTLDKEQRTLVQ